MAEKTNKKDNSREELAELRKKVRRLEKELAIEKKREAELIEKDEKLEQAYARFSAVMDTLDSGILVTHLETYEILFANKYARDTFGAIVGVTCYECFNEYKDTPCRFCRDETLLDEKGKPNGIHVSEFSSFQNGQGYELHLQAIRWVDGTMVRLSLSTNIEERIKMEEEMLKRKNLESLGTLAGGIAHDFNNLLAAILGNISLIRLSGRLHQSLRTPLETAEKAVRLATGLSDQLLTFSRGEVPHHKILDPFTLMRNIAGDAVSGTPVDIRFQIGKDTWPLFADEVQVSIAFRHLVSNAIEAMPRGGEIAVDAENIAGPQLDSLPVEGTKFVRIGIQDEGKGISEENLKNIFDPYFTTKPMGPDKGTGLGLSVVYSVIKKHGGHIEVGSREGEGTKVDVYLPASDQALQEEPVITDIDKPEHAQMARKVLVMDDEHFLREMLRHMSQELGYICVTATKGEEVLLLFQEAIEADEPFDRVVMDLTIKDGMGAKRAIKKLQQLNPEVYAVVTSGYGLDDIVRSYRDYGFKAVLPKPFTIEDFIAVLEL